MTTTTTSSTADLLAELLVRVLGIYRERGELDHDMAMRLESLVEEFEGTDVERDAAFVSLRRVLRGAK